MKVRETVLEGVLAGAECRSELSAAFEFQIMLPLGKGRHIRVRLRSIGSEARVFSFVNFFSVAQISGSLTTLSELMPSVMVFGCDRRWACIDVRGHLVQKGLVLVPGEQTWCAHALGSRNK